MTDTTEGNQAASAEYDGLPILHATKNSEAKGGIKGHLAPFAVFVAVCAFHIGICIVFNLFEAAPVENLALEAIPVDLVTAPPAEKSQPSPPKTFAADAKAQGTDNAQEKAEKEKVEKEKAEKEKAETAQEKPQEKPQEKAPEKPQEQAQQAQPPAAAPEPPKPAPQPPKPEAQKADLQKPAKADNRKPPPQHSEPAKTSPANRSKQEPPRAQTALQPEQSRQTAAASQPAPLTSNLPSAPALFSMTSENFRAIAVPQTSEDGDDTLSYQTIVFSRLELSKHFPEAARARGAHGSAGIAFTLDNAGNVLDVELLVPSGDPDLDEESVALVHRAAPFPPPPPGAETRVTAVITFDSPPPQ